MCPLPTSQFLQFLTDTNLIDSESAGRRQQDFQLLFEGINASKGGEPSTTEFNAKRALNREEWVSMLLQVALACYVVPGKVSVVEGVRRLFTEDICPKVNSSALHEANSLREEHCYKEVTDLVLRNYRDVPASHPTD